MSMVGSNSNTISKMNQKPTFHDFKKQASFILKEKIKTARLALTDVTPAQLLAEEVTNGDPGGPDTQSLKMISKAAFEVDDYWRIVDILHKRLVRFDKPNWRASYKALIVLEYLLTHGPESVAQEFQKERDVITDIGLFQHVDEKGFNWGLNVRRKCDRVLRLLDKGPLLKEEREKARKISRGIEGFGSFCIRTSSTQESSSKTFQRCNSQFNNEDAFTLASIENVLVNTTSLAKESSMTQSYDIFGETSKPMLNEQRSELSVEDLHPFDETEHLTSQSLLSVAHQNVDSEMS
ncbi:clathrin interactor EPSIN 1 [Salvia divinorum]|uniref:Clathrin interactor EPSIN 1 n=1 Tax=Salvia divinorum TaxID=28513 RepID=A0ABD1GMB2_SALDI